MQIRKFVHTTSLCTALFGASLLHAEAGNVFKADVPDTLNLATSWSNSVAPTIADVATWDATVQVNNTSVLGGNLSWAGITILNPALGITINTNTGGNVLTLGAAGIDMSQATTNLTLNTTVALGAAQTWTVDTNGTLADYALISGGAGLTLTKNGPGILVLAGTNTYSGGTVINAGTVIPTNATSFGTGGITNAGGTLFFGTPPAGAPAFVNGGIIANAFTITNVTGIDMASRGGVSVVASGAWSGNGTVAVTNLATGSTFTFGGASGGNMANFTGSVIVSSNSTGTIRFNNGGSSVNTGNASASFDLGQGTAIMMSRNGTTINIGELNGGPGTFVNGQGSGSGTTTWSVGGKNTSTTFAGTFKNNAANQLSALTKVGTGTLTLTGNATTTGALTINAGTVQFGDGVTAGTGIWGTGNITDNATLIFARPDAISVGNIISGTGTFVASGSNILSLISANTYTGPTIVTNNATLQVAAVGAIPPATALTLGGAGTAGTLDLEGNNVQVSALNSGIGATGGTIGSTGGTAGTLLIVNATNGASTFNGVIQDTLPAGGSGTVALTVQNGTVTLGGANTYSGQTTISNGTLALAAGGSIASSTAVVLAGNGAVLDGTAVGGFGLGANHILAGVGSVDGNVVAAADSIITPGTNGVVGTLTLSDLVMNGGVTNVFDLSTSVTGGNDQILVTGSLDLSGVNVIQINPLTGNLSPGTYHLFVCGAVTGTVANVQLVSNLGAGLNAQLSVTGTTVDLVVTATAAPLVWHGDGSLNQWDFTTANWKSNSNPVLYSDGSFVLFDDTGSTTPAVDITGPVTPASLTVNASVNYTLGSVGGSGKITGTTTVTKTNTGTLTLLTPNDFTGGLTISQGTVQVGNGTVSGSTPGNSPTLDNGTLAFDQPDNFEFTNIISGTGSLTQEGTGILTLSGDNTYAGTTLVASGTLQVGDGNTSGLIGTNGVTVATNASLVFNRSDTVTELGQITGAGTLTQQGAGTLIVTASNNFTGGTTIAAGTLQLGNGGTNGSVPTNITDNGTLAFDHSQDETYAAAIVGAGGISKQGTNTLTLSGANIYNGNTSISHGTLIPATLTAIPTGPGDGNVVLNGSASAAGTLEINGLDLTLNGVSGSANTFVGQIVNNLGTGTNVLTIGNGDATTSFNGTIEDNNNGGAGRIALVKIGAGTITFDNTNSYTGGTIISNGVLATGNATANGSGGFSAFGPTQNFIVFKGGGLTLFNSGSDNGSTVFTFSNPLLVPAGQTGTVTMFERGDLDSTLTGSGTLNINSAGVRGTLAGDWSAFTGTLVAASGQIRLNNTAFGYTNAIWVITNSADLDTGADGNPGASGQTINIGELDGDSSTFIGNGNKPSANQTWSIGWLNTTSSYAGAIVAGSGNSVTKVGTGTLILSGGNTYVGPTVISNGVLSVVDPGSISSSSNINVTGTGILDVSGVNGGVLSLNNLLQGTGLVRGGVSANPGATVSPGGAAIGTLTITNGLQLQSGSATVMDLNKAGNTNDVINVGGALSYAGTLQLNYSDTRSLGDTFHLFHAASYSGTFDAISPAVPGNGLSWDTSQLASTGTLLVAQGVAFKIATFGITNGNFNLTGSGGVPNAPYNILSSTNVALPIGQWTTNGPFNFDGSGGFIFSVPVDTNAPQQFYTVQIPQ